MGDILIPFGKDAVIYYDTAGSQALDEDKYFSGIKDVTATMDKDEADASRRAYPGWHDQRVGMKNLRVSFEVQGVSFDDVGTEDTELHSVLRELFLTELYDSEVGIALYVRSTGVSPANPNGDAVGQGMWGDFLMTKFDRNEPLGDLQTYSVEMAMTIIHGITPQWSSTNPS